MSSETTPEERTEMPTERRMGQLRKEGTLHLSIDLVQVLSLLSGFLALGSMWSYLRNDMELALKGSFSMMQRTEPLLVDDLNDGFQKLLLLMAPNVVIITLIIATASSLAVMLQTDWNVREKKIRFRFDMLNPINGIKRIFSMQGVVNTLKALLKLAIILPIAYFVLEGFAPSMLSLVHLSVEQVMVYSGMGIEKLFWRILAVLIVFAIFDYVWGKFQWLKANKMTKNEVKDERKSIEGDEETRRKIISKGLNRIVQRIRQSVPKADVVVTNPTHISIALKYDKNSMSAPTVVAKGKGFVALKIREIAKEHGIPVVERKPVARALFQSTEVGATIPRELFRAVAEILAYVYRLRNPYRYQAAAGAQEETSE